MENNIRPYYMGIVCINKQLFVVLCIGLGIGHSGTAQENFKWDKTRLCLLVDYIWTGLKGTL